MNKDVQKPCKCRTLRIRSSSVHEAEYCCACGQTRHHVKLNAEQRKIFKNSISFKSKGSVHELFHKFLKTMFDDSRPFGTKEKYTGYEMMCEMRKFINKNPAIIECRVDDDYHAGSSLYLIPHEDQYELWGVSVMYVPQCTGEKPIRFFLYPGHIKGLLEGLEKMAKIARKHGDKKLDGCCWESKRPNSFDALPESIARPKPDDLKPESTPYVMPPAQKKKSDEQWQKALQALDIKRKAWRKARIKELKAELQKLEEQSAE